MLVNTLEDARASHRNLYALYVDFTNAFNTISHTKLYFILHELGFPPDAIAVIRGIYVSTSTRIG